MYNYIIKYMMDVYFERNVLNQPNFLFCQWATPVSLLSEQPSLKKET